MTLVDPAAHGENASGVAAGMLAPAFEAVLDNGARGSFPLLKTARDLWPALAERLGDDIGFRRSGAAWLDLPDEPPRHEACAAELASVGAVIDMWDAVELRARVPDLSIAPGRALFTPEDWRLDPPAALQALRRAALSTGVRLVVGQVVGFDHGRVRFARGGALEADSLIVATGFARPDLAPELAALSPIKGQLLCFPTVRAADDRPALRTALGYLAPGLGGLRVGATMEVGARDRDVELSRVEPFIGLARTLFPACEDASFEARAGVRAATPDGLPMVGPSAVPGIHLAVGARRNGWLLAPLVAEMTAAYLAGRDPGPFAGRLASDRRMEGEGVCRVSG